MLLKNIFQKQIKIQTEISTPNINNISRKVPYLQSYTIDEQRKLINDISDNVMYYIIHDPHGLHEAAKHILTFSILYRGQLIQMFNIVNHVKILTKEMATQICCLHTQLAKDQFAVLGYLTNQEQFFFWQLYIQAIRRVAEYHDIFTIFQKLYRVFIYKSTRLPLQNQKQLLFDTLELLLINNNTQYDVSQYILKSQYSAFFNDLVERIYIRYIECDSIRVQAFLKECFNDQNQLKRQHQIILFLRSVLYCLQHQIYDVFTDACYAKVRTLIQQCITYKHGEIKELIDALKQYHELYESCQNSEKQDSSYLLKLTTNT